MNHEPTKPDDDAPETVPEAPKKRGRGFASMDPERVKELASIGGKAAHAAGTAHRWSADEASAAGRKGGMASHSRRSSGRPRNPPEST